jgi:hypothetical protein
LIQDIIDPLDGDILQRSRLAELVLGTFPGLSGTPADVVIDCINTATAVSYQNVYELAHGVAAACRDSDSGVSSVDAEHLISALYIPQLVRHVQLLNEAMRRGQTEAYIKVGTSGTGGMGLNIPYTHGEERPSRLLLSKNAIAGAQSHLIFAMARTPGPPHIVKELKPSAMIGWKEIAHGPITRAGKPIELWDCPTEMAVSLDAPGCTKVRGDFGARADGTLEGSYIDTGENGLFSAGEFSAITAPQQMGMVTAEEIAINVARELAGQNTGRDIVAALDGAVMEPSYRGGILRRTALERLRELEQETEEAVAYEILGPPRLSKLLFEAHLVKRAVGSPAAVSGATPQRLSELVERRIAEDTQLRQRIISIGLGVLLADGQRLLRGPVLKSDNAEGGWVDLTIANMARWQSRMVACRAQLEPAAADGTSSGAATGCAVPDTETGMDIGDIAAWIFVREDNGARMKP